MDFSLNLRADRLKIPIRDMFFVVLQFILFVAYAFEINSMRVLFPELLFWIGVGMLFFGGLISVVAVLQLNIHLSPFPSPLPGSKLIQTGVFKYVRHPIYSGIVLAFFGFALIADSGYKLLIALFLLILFYFKSQYEELRLMELFPEYENYKLKSGRFLPKFW